MRIHSDILTSADVHKSTTAAGMRGVYADVSTHGSRSHARSLDVSLTGTSSRRPNPGTGGRYSDDHAATWDEWGMLLSALFEIDPAAIVGTVKRPIYAGRDHFHMVTGERYEALTAPYQHGAGGHRWQFSGTPRVFECTSCEATRRHDIDPAPFLDALKRASA